MKELVVVGLRYNPPPGWPPAPEGFTPPPGWQPDPSWPPPPPGWQLWVNDDQMPTPDSSQQTIQAGPGSPYDGGNPYAYGGAGGPYGTSYGGYGNPYAPPGRPYSRKTSGWAIASFVLGLLGGVLLSVIFAFIALSRIKRLGQQGRGFAIAGLVLSGLWVLLIILAVAVANLGSAGRSSSTGAITHGGGLSVFSLAVGDCFNSPSDTQDVASVTAEPCNQPHSAQIYARFNLAGSNFSYPGTATVTRQAANGCTARTGSIDRSKTTNAMTVHFLFPDQNAWLGGQRTVACMIVNPTADLTYSLLNT